MKVHIRRLTRHSKRPLWNTEYQRESLRKELNELGFYALTGDDMESIEVFAVSDDTPADIAALNKSLDIAEHMWHALIKGVL